MRPFLEQMQEFQGASAQTAAIYAALEQQLGKAQAAQDDFFAQLDLETATWALPMWERAYGLEAEESKPHAYRRERVKARMRGQGTTTAAMLRNVAESFTNGAVEVEERPGERRVILWYGGTEQAPENVRGIDAAIRNIMPAHIAYLFEYLYAMQVRNSNSLAQRTACFAFAVENLGIETVQLDGMRRLDGMWPLTSLHTRGLDMSWMEVSVSNKHRIANGLAEKYAVCHRTVQHASSKSFVCTVNDKTMLKPLTQCRHAIVGGIKNRNRSTVTLVADSMWRLDDSNNMAGSKRLNAEILRSEL